MMKQPTLEQKALQVIEHIVSDDFTENAELKLYSKMSFTQDEAKLMARKLTDIYMFSHSVNPVSCYGSHVKWRENLTKLYNKLRKSGEFKHFSIPKENLK